MPIEPIGFDETEDEYVARLEAEVARLDRIVGLAATDAGTQMSDEQKKTTLYLERAKVRGIILRSQEIGGEVTQSLLMQVDHLPIVTVDDMRGPAAAPASGDFSVLPGEDGDFAIGHLQSALADIDISAYNAAKWRIGKAIAVLRTVLSPSPIAGQELVIASQQEIFALREWKAAILGKCKASDGFDALEWGGDKEGWGFVHYFIGHLETRALHAETVLAEQDATLVSRPMQARVEKTGGSQS